MEKKNETQKIILPCGQFCGENCSTCPYWDTSDTRPGGYAYCTYMNGYKRAQERNGCIHHPKN